MMRLWRMLRTALRPLPRPGVVLMEDFGRPGDTSGLPDLCDCDAPVGTPPGEKHRGPGTWTSACLSYRQDWTTSPPDRPNPDAALFALHARASRMLEEARTSAECREIVAQVVAESSGQACGMALPRPEMATVIRPPRSEYRRPAPTSVPSGGKHRSG